MVSWSCTGLGVAGEETGWCALRLAQQQVVLYIVVVEALCSAAAVSKMNRLTVCLSHLAVN